MSKEILQRVGEKLYAGFVLKLQFHEDDLTEVNCIKLASGVWMHCSFTEVNKNKVIGN